MLPKGRQAVAGIAAAVWTSVCLAQAPEPPDALATRGGVEAGLQASHYRYEEPGVMWLKGARAGLSASYTALGTSDVHVRFEGRYSYGKLDYEGSGSLFGLPDHLLELRALAGLDYRRVGLTWVPYAGLGIRYLYNDARGLTTTGYLGYRRRSHYFYVPLGVALRVPLGSSWAMVPQIELDAFARGSQRSYLSDVGPGYLSVTNRQQHGAGYRMQLMFEGRRWSFGPWMHYWDIKDSDIRSFGPGFGLEPENWTRETGVELRYRF